MCIEFPGPVLSAFARNHADFFNQTIRRKISALASD